MSGNHLSAVLIVFHCKNNFLFLRLCNQPITPTHHILKLWTLSLSESMIWKSYFVSIPYGCGGPQLGLIYYTYLGVGISIHWITWFQLMSLELVHNRWEKCHINCMWTFVSGFSWVSFPLNTNQKLILTCNSNERGKILLWLFIPLWISIPLAFWLSLANMEILTSMPLV